MAKRLFLEFSIFFLLICSPAFAEHAAKVAYVSSSGKAYKDSNPNKDLGNGQKLAARDRIVLKDGAKIRLYFTESRECRKYTAPVTISISEELEKFKNHSQNSDIGQRAGTELRAFFTRYFNPSYKNKAAIRGGIKTLLSFVPSYRLRPHFVFFSKRKPQTLSIFEIQAGKPGRKVAQIRIDANQSFAALSRASSGLEYGKDYLWCMDDQNQSGLVSIVRKNEALDVERVINAIEQEAVDEPEACRVIAAYLFEQGFWTEAYSYAQSGLQYEKEKETFEAQKEMILSEGPGLAVARVLITADLNHVKNHLELQTFILRPDSSCLDGAECFEFPDMGHFRRSGPFSLKQMKQEVAKPGDVVLFALKNTSKTDYYCCLIYMDLNKKAWFLYPINGRLAETAVLKAGKDLDIYKEEKRSPLLLDMPRKEIVHFLATPVPIDMSLLDRKDLAKTNDFPGSRVERIVRNAIQEGGLKRSLLLEGWGSIHLEIEVSSGE